MRPHLVTIHLEMVLRTSRPFVLVKIRYLKFWGDDDIRYQAKTRQVHERIVTKALKSSKSLLEEIKLPSFSRCRRRSFCGQEYRLCCEVVMRQCVGCRPLNGDRGVEIDIPLGILLMIFVDLVGLSRRLPFKDGGRNVTRVIMHDWRRVIRRQSIRVSHPVVSQMGVVIVPQCAPFSSYRVWERMVCDSWESWVCFGSRTNSGSGGHIFLHELCHS